MKVVIDGREIDGEGVIATVLSEVGVHNIMSGAFNAMGVCQAYLFAKAQFEENVPEPMRELVIMIANTNNKMGENSSQKTDSEDPLSEFIKLLKADEKGQ